MNTIASTFARRLSLALFAVIATVAHAQVATFNSRGAFTSSASGLVTESMNGLDGSSTGLPGPFDSNASPGGYFPANTFAQGIQINAIGGDGNALAFGRSGFLEVTATDKFVTTNQNANGVKLQFLFTNAATTAVGFDAYYPGDNSSANSSTINVYSLTNSLLYTGSLALAQSGTFFGITSGSPIGQVTLETFYFGGIGNVEVADNISFGTASAIPEPSTYAAMAGAAMLGLAIWRRRTSASVATVAVS
jgi:hypothetical protein